jgi:hydrogenase-4 membrane subunit HyfE
VSPLLIAFVGVLLVPVFVATWRTSLLGLSSQGFLMAWLAYRMNPGPLEAGDWLTLGDLVLVRGLGAPLALYAVLRASKAPPRNDVIPANLLSWTITFGLVLVGFSFSESLVPEPGHQQHLVAVAATALLLGFLVLGTQAGPLSQIIGALRVENAIALFELGGARHHAPLAVHLAQIAVVTATLALFPWYLRTLSAAPIPTPGEEPPTL